MFFLKNIINIFWKSMTQRSSINNLGEFSPTLLFDCEVLKGEIYLTLSQVNVYFAGRMIH